MRDIVAAIGALEGRDTLPPQMEAGAPSLRQSDAYHSNCYSRVTTSCRAFRRIKILSGAEVKAKESAGNRNGNTAD
jgi:hypothetical protein